jgi:hypothetical protein
MSFHVSIKMRDHYLEQRINIKYDYFLRNTVLCFTSIERWSQCGTIFAENFSMFTFSFRVILFPYLHLTLSHHSHSHSFIWMSQMSDLSNIFISLAGGWVTAPYSIMDIFLTFFKSFASVQDFCSWIYFNSISLFHHVKFFTCWFV